ncbi:MAG: hypothetical protein KGI73_00910 [Patescibacteria group bacterium]|nr:hypothetical protein [Patescibacteria group bacterium]
MRIMVWNMRWMTRYVGFIARPIVRLYGDNEIIACGLRSEDGSVGIIYTPGTGHTNHSVVVREDGQWVPAAFNAASNFSGSVVRNLALPHAPSGTLFKMTGTKATGKQLSSPTITVKPRTAYEPELLEVRSEGVGVAFSWRHGKSRDPMIYFLAVEDAHGERTYSAIYTRETFWRYPEIKRASYSVGPVRPPILTASERYIAKLVLVDYDGWVSHVAVQEFSPSS